MEWKQFPIAEFSHLFSVSEYGDVKKLSRKSKWKYCDDTKEIILKWKTQWKKGYQRISFKVNGKSKQYFVHRLVALAFIPNPDNKPCVNHKDADKKNNHVSNLEWCTDAENNEHARLMGLFLGSNSKIPKEQRRFIKENFFVVGRKKLAEMFGLTEDYVLGVAKVKVRGTNECKKAPVRVKEIVNTETGETYDANALALLWGTSRKEVCRTINEERKPNETPFRYTGKYISMKNDS